MPKWYEDIADRAMQATETGITKREPCEELLDSIEEDLDTLHQ